MKMAKSGNLSLCLFLAILDVIYGNSAPAFLNDTYPATKHFDEGTGTPSGTLLHTFTVSDADGSMYTMTYTFTPADGEDMFSITDDTVAGTYTVTLASGKTFDYETQNSYAIKAEANDGVLSSTALITFEIDDVGEAPTLSPDTPVQTFTIDENTFNTYIGSPDFAIVDHDLLEEHVYSINSSIGTGSAFIEINPDDGGIKLKIDYDREAPGTPASVWVHVDITDKYGLSATTTFSVIVNDVNDETPVFNVTNVDITVDADTTTGTTLAILGASDADAEAPNNVVTLSVDSSTAASYFEMDGFELNLKTYIDIPAGTTGLGFNVYAIDSGTPANTGSAVVTINLPASTTTTTTTLIPPVGYSWIGETSNQILLVMMCVSASVFTSYCCLMCWRWHTYGQCLPAKCPTRTECHTYFERCCICCQRKTSGERPPRGTSAISFSLVGDRGTPMSITPEPFVFGKKGLPKMLAQAPVATSLQRKPKADLTSGHGKWTAY